MKKHDLQTTTWFVLTEYAERYNTQGFTKSTIERTTKLLDLFPSQPQKIDGVWVYADEQANRCGLMIVDTVVYLKHMYHVPFTIDYPFRSEFVNFKTIGDIDIYLVKKMRKLVGDRRD